MSDQRHNRFFVPPGKIVENMFSIAGEEFNHAKVKRLKVGAMVTAVDGAGTEYFGDVSSLSKDRIVCRIIRTVKHSPPPLKIHLGIGVIRPGPMSIAVEKAVEAGVWRIIPIETDNSERKLSAQDIPRLNRIAVSAMKQSGGAYLPEVAPIIPVKQLISAWLEAGMILFADMEGKSLLSVKIGEGDVLILIGPEGGFSQKEIEYLQEIGGYSVSLGARRFRTETAAIVSVAGLMLNNA